MLSSSSLGRLCCFVKSVGGRRPAVPVCLGPRIWGCRTSHAETGEAQANRTMGASGKDRRHFSPCRLEHLSLCLSVRWKVFLTMQLTCSFLRFLPLSHPGRYRRRGATFPSCEALWPPAACARHPARGGASSVCSELAQIHTLESEMLTRVVHWFQVQSSWPSPAWACSGLGWGPPPTPRCTPVRSPISKPCRWSARTEGPGTTPCDPRQGSRLLHPGLGGCHPSAGAFLGPWCVRRTLASFLSL